MASIEELKRLTGVNKNRLEVYFLKCNRCEHYPSLVSRSLLCDKCGDLLDTICFCLKGGTNDDDFRIYARKIKNGYKVRHYVDFMESRVKSGFNS